MLAHPIGWHGPPSNYRITGPKNAASHWDEYLTAGD